MATGACGIDCDVCRLNMLGACTTCGSGRSEDGAKKMAAQVRLLGAPCPILACALENQIEFCLRDCDRFPCDLFEKGPYPYAEGFLHMQQRRRAEGPVLTAPSGNPTDVPPDYWDDLSNRNLSIVCENAGAQLYPDRGLLLPFLYEYILVDIQNRGLFRQGHAKWEPLRDALLELISLVYLRHATPAIPKNEIVGVRQLKSAHFFTGPHELEIDPLLDLFGHDPDGFRKAAEGLRGEPVDMGDAAYRFAAFPKVPLYYVLWVGDDEFQPRLSVLFDRTIDQHLAPDAVWGLVNLVSDRLSRTK